MEATELNALILAAIKYGIIKQREKDGFYYYMSNKLGEGLEDTTKKLNEKPTLIELIKEKVANFTNANAANIPGTESKSAGEDNMPSQTQKTFTLEEAKELVADALKDFADTHQLAKTKADPRPGTEKHLLEEGADVYDPDDELETPVIFYSYRKNFIITGTRKNHKEMPNPVGHYNNDNEWEAEPIKFEEIKSQRSGRNAKENKIVYLCGYQCTSKKQVKWLRAIPQYGAYFFEKPKDLSKVDYDVERARIDAYEQVERMNTQQKLSYYNNLKLGEQTTDMDLIRLKIIEHKAEQIAQNNEIQNKRQALDTLQRMESYGSGGISKASVATA